MGGSVRGEVLPAGAGAVAGGAHQVPARTRHTQGSAGR